jgi:hypothetical protein
MKRLNLDAFKAQTETSQTDELENLAGGILGACHCRQCDLQMEMSPDWEDGSAGYNFGVMLMHALGMHDDY